MWTFSPFRLQVTSGPFKLKAWLEPALVYLLSILKKKCKKIKVADLVFFREEIHQNKHKFSPVSFQITKRNDYLSQISGIWRFFFPSRISFHVVCFSSYARSPASDSHKVQKKKKKSRSSRVEQGCAAEALSLGPHKSSPTAFSLFGGIGALRLCAVRQQHKEWLQTSLLIRTTNGSDIELVHGKETPTWPFLSTKSTQFVLFSPRF